MYIYIYNVYIYIYIHGVIQFDPSPLSGARVYFKKLKVLNLNSQAHVFLFFSIISTWYA